MMLVMRLNNSWNRLHRLRNLPWLLESTGSNNLLSYPNKSVNNFNNTIIINNPMDLTNRQEISNMDPIHSKDHHMDHLNPTNNLDHIMLHYMDILHHMDLLHLMELPTILNMELPSSINMVTIRCNLTNTHLVIILHHHNSIIRTRTPTVAKTYMMAIPTRNQLWLKLPPYLREGSQPPDKRFQKRYRMSQRKSPLRQTPFVRHPKNTLRMCW